MGRAKQAALHFGATSVANIVERVIFQEVAIKNLVAILLIDVATMVGALLVLDACAEDVFAVLVVDCFPLG